MCRSVSSSEVGAKNAGYLRVLPLGGAPPHCGAWNPLQLCRVEADGLAPQLRLKVLNVSSAVRDDILHQLRHRPLGDSGIVWARRASTKENDGFLLGSSSWMWAAMSSRSSCKKSPRCLAPLARVMGLMQSSSTSHTMYSVVVGLGDHKVVSHLCAANAVEYTDEDDWSALWNLSGGSTRLFLSGTPSGHGAPSQSHHSGGIGLVPFVVLFLRSRGWPISWWPFLTFPCG